MSKHIFTVHWVDTYQVLVLAKTMKEAIDYVQDIDCWYDSREMSIQFVTYGASKLRQNDPLPIGVDDSYVLWGKHKKDITLGEARKVVYERTI